MTPTALLREIVARARYTGAGEAEMYADAELVMALQLVATEALAIESGTVLDDSLRDLRVEGSEYGLRIPHARVVGPDHARANEALALACVCLRARLQGERFLPADVAARIEALCGEDRDG